MEGFLVVVAWLADGTLGAERRLDEVPEYACLQAPSGAPYAPIAAVPGATMLGVSFADDHVEEVPLPFAFPWFGETLTSVVVTSNGQLNMAGSPSPACCVPFPITPEVTCMGGHLFNYFDDTDFDDFFGGYFDDTYAYDDHYSYSYFNEDVPCDRVAFTQTDLSPLLSGAVFALATGSSFVVSFEGVAFYSSYYASAVVNAQVELFENGDIEIRWGPGGTGGNSIAAGVQGGDVYAPVEVPNFVDGVTSTWPAFQTVHFMCGLLTEITQAPTPQPTETFSPTDSPQPTAMPTACLPGSFTDAKTNECVLCSPGTYTTNGRELRCIDQRPLMCFSR